MTPDRLRELEDIQNANCPCVECAGIRELVAEVRRLQAERDAAVETLETYKEESGIVKDVAYVDSLNASLHKEAGEVARLRALLAQLADAAGPFALQAEIMDNGNDNPPPDRDAMKGYLGSPWPTIGDCRRLAAARDAARTALEEKQ